MVAIVKVALSASLSPPQAAKENIMTTTKDKTNKVCIVFFMVRTPFKLYFCIKHT